MICRHWAVRLAIGQSRGPSVRSPLAILVAGTLGSTTARSELGPLATSGVDPLLSASVALRLLCLAKNLLRYRISPLNRPHDLSYLDPYYPHPPHDASSSHAHVAPDVDQLCPHQSVCLVVGYPRCHLSQPIGFWGYALSPWS